MKREVKRLSHGELVQMSVAQQNATATPASTHARLSHGELVQLAIAKQNEGASNPAPVDENSTKYLNMMPLDELYSFFIPFGIDDMSQIQETKDENKRIKGLKLFCDDFNVTLSSDFKFQFDFFDHYAGDRNSLGKTIKYYEIAQLSDMLNLSRNQTMTLLLTGLFINKFPNYEKEWMQLFEAGKIPAFKQNALPKAFTNLDNMKTLFELTKVIKQQQADTVGKQLA